MLFEDSSSSNNKCTRIKMTDKVVALGEQISPQVNLTGAVEVAERLYGIKVESAKELDGYDDKNYHLKVYEPPNNKFIKDLWPYGYVLKIMNSSDSKKLDCVEGQCEMMMHLDKCGIVTPQPQKNTNGKFYSLEKLPNEGNEYVQKSNQHVVRLLSFQEGTLMKDIPWSYTLHYKVGRYAAQVDLVLKDFFHPVYKQYSSLWLLKNASYIKGYLFIINDENKSTLVKNVIDNFEECVMSRFNTLKLGMIHGDIHYENLLCKQDSTDEWDISAILDLGDSHISAYVMELGITMAYMMLLSEDLQSGTQVIAGYCSLHPLPLNELKLLKVCVCARLCQSLVLGLYTHSQYPNNGYVLNTQKKGWSLLQTLWNTNSTHLENAWFNNIPISK